MRNKKSLFTISAQNTDLKPRLPLESVYHENEYDQDKEEIRNRLEIYNQIISEYYDERTNGKRNDSWTSQMANMLEKQSRMYMKEFVEKLELNLK
ncbi:hypothetical protein [Bacillus sp. FJAT-29937]|uniref:hypothetical protein n=1 Tax=Bacillus sp. FJAT-29937 TaxID=1720553 RepID=UPI00082BE228